MGTKSGRALERLSRNVELPEWLDRWTIGGTAATTAALRLAWSRLLRPSAGPGIARRFISWVITLPGRELENLRLREDNRRLDRLLTISTALNDQHISTLEKVAGIGSSHAISDRPAPTLPTTPPSSKSNSSAPITSLK
jgi:hypothetical protein